ncbi:hypothetical protein DD581_22145 [Klebsiella pneumoniae]|nr:hypothetical protein DD581_22145 [Klebsiella pneumoniae]
MGRIMQLRDLLKERYHFEAFTVPYPTLNLGAIHGGDASNRICSRSAPIKAICPTRSVFRASPATPAIRRAGSTRLS